MANRFGVCCDHGVLSRGPWKAAGTASAKLVQRVGDNNPSKSVFDTCEPVFSNLRDLSRGGRRMASTPGGSDFSCLKE